MKKITLLLVVFLLAGCVMPGSNGKSRYTDKKKDVAYVENDHVSTQLAIAASKASAAIIELAEVEKVRTPTTVAPIIENAPRLLRQPMSITWNGPIGPLAQKIAERAMYGYVQIGVEPTTPILVQVDAIRYPLIDILRDIGMQAGARANVVVDVENRNIEVHYVETLENL